MSASLTNEGGSICLILPCFALSGGVNIREAKLPMQVIYAIDIDPEDYATNGFQKQISPPYRCPNCREVKALSALGYYERNLSRIRIGALAIFIRRFRCRHCGKTTSMLPAFAQPYRFVQNRTIERFFSGEAFSDEVIRHLDLLSRYWRRFGIFLPVIDRSLGKALERAPPGQPRAAWRVLVHLYEDLASVTKVLVTAHQITLFGRYRCHRPNGKRKRAD